MRRLHARVAVVTGAASGIGLATAEALGRRGCDVALVDIDARGLSAAADRVRATGRVVSTFEVDVADRDRMRALPEAVVREHGAVHILVNNAGVSVGSTLEELDLEDFDWIVGINFWGVVHGCAFFLPYLRREDEAHIVNISSMFGLVGIPSQSTYCATKFAVRGFSEAIWTELADSGIGVTSVHPGGVRTNIVRSSRSVQPEMKRRTIEQFDRRAVAPERIARKIVRAIERNRMRLVVCPEAHVADLAKRIAPALAQRLVLWGYRRAGSIG